MINMTRFSVKSQNNYSINTTLKSQEYASASDKNFDKATNLVFVFLFWIYMHRSFHLEPARTM